MSTDWAALRGELLGQREWTLPPRLKLPMLPSAVVNFMKQASEPRASAKSLGAIVQTDAGLTCELLKHVNSASMGLRNPANSTTHAISLLGIRKVKLFVCTTAVRRAMPKGSSVIDPQAFWNTNLERALFSRRLAKLMRVDGDLAFAGAMLQDFLLPILALQLPEEYGRVCEDRTTDSVPIDQVERDRFGWDHGFAAAQLAHDWGLPDDLVCCIALHHIGPSVLRDERLRNTSVAAVALASLMPDPLLQVPFGLEVLTRLDAAWPAFDLLEEARGVAAEFAEMAPDQVGRHTTFAESCEPQPAPAEDEPRPHDDARCEADDANDANDADDENENPNCAAADETRKVVVEAVT